MSDDITAINTLANGASYTVRDEALDRLRTTIETGVEAELGNRTTLKFEYMERLEKTTPTTLVC